MLKSTNRIVGNALMAKDGKDGGLAAANGRIEDKVRVTLECFDFNGLRRETKVMTLAGLRQLLQQIKTRMSGTYDRVVHDIEKNGCTDMALDPKLTLWVSWASRA